MTGERHLDENAPEADPPEPFEVSCHFPLGLDYRADAVLSVPFRQRHINYRIPLYFSIVRFIALISLSIVFRSEDPDFIEELCQL